MTETTDKTKTGGFYLSKNRLEALTDGIFAIAMTLLVLNLALPQMDSSGVAVDPLHALLLGQIHEFVNYAIAFVLIAIFWIMHHQQFHAIKRTDQFLIWINIVILMFIALMPFSTAILGDYQGHKTAAVFFSANLFILGLLFLVNWIHATRKDHLFDEHADPQLVRRGLLRNSVIPAVSVIALILSLLWPEHAMWVYLSVPLILYLRPFRAQR